MYNTNNTKNREAAVYYHPPHHNNQGGSGAHLPQGQRSADQGRTQHGDRPGCLALRVEPYVGPTKAALSTRYGPGTANGPAREVYYSSTQTATRYGPDTTNGSARGV